MNATDKVESVFERAKRGGAVQCTERDYDEALGSLPPEEYLPHGFVLGEQYDWNRWYCFWQFDGAFWCMLTCPEDYRRVLHINASGVTYSAKDAVKQ
jgi:hypothetical protein